MSIAKLISVLTLISLVGAYIYFSEDRYAKADDLKYNYVQDRIRDLKVNIRWYQDQMSWIMSRCGKQDPRTLPEHAFASYEHNRKQKEMLEAELKAALGKQ